jgi:hypothetical protein
LVRFSSCRRILAEPLSLSVSCLSRYRESEGRLLLIVASADMTLEPAASVRAGLRTIERRATSQCAKMARQSLRSLRRGFVLLRIASVRSRPRSATGALPKTCRVAGSHLKALRFASVDVCHNQQHLSWKRVDCPRSLDLVAIGRTPHRLPASAPPRLRASSFP